MKNIVDELFPGLSTGNQMDEDLKLTKGDHKVIDAFIDAQSADSEKLHSDGSRLDGTWIGGNDLARWDGNKIVPGMGQPHGRAGQVVLRAVKKATPSKLLGGIWP